MVGKTFYKFSVLENFWDKSQRLSVIAAKAAIQIYLHFPGFRVALAIASSPGMTLNFVGNFCVRTLVRHS
jgi:hypothetical protein